MRPLACSATAIPAGCCHTLGGRTGMGRRNKDRDRPTVADGSFSKRWLMGLVGIPFRGRRVEEDGGALLKP